MLVGLVSQSEQIKKIILEINNTIAEFILKITKSKIVLTKQSTISKVKKLTKSNIKEFNSDYGRNIEEFNHIISYIESMESLDQKINSLSSLNTPLLRTVNKIIESNLSNGDKQVAIETCLIEYEIDYFNKNMNTPGARSQLLHKIYPQFKKDYEGLIKEYSVNKYFKLKKGIHSLKLTNFDSGNKEYFKIIVILIIMYLGTEKCISYSFSQVINLLGNNTENNKRTNIVISLGSKFNRLLKTIKIEHNSEINQIFSFEVEHHFP